MSVERYQFIASGHESVVAAFKSIGASAASANAHVARSFEGVPRVAARSAGRVVDAEERAQAKRIAILQRADAARRSRIERSQEAELKALEKKLAREMALEEKAAAKRVALAQKASAADARAAEKASAARWRTANRAVSWLGGAAMAGLGVVAGVSGMALRQSLALDEKSRRIAIQGSSGADRQNPDALRRHFENVAISTPGATAMGVAQGTEAFMAKTGDLDAAKRFSRTWAEVSVATSASIEDIASASADLMQKLDIKKTEDMAKALAILGEQGKRGAFELKDAAKEYPKIAAAAQRFGIGKGVGALATLGGLTQLARSSTGSAEEAGTSVERMFSQLSMKAGKLQAGYGIDVYKGDIKDRLVDIVGKVGGNDMAKKRAGLQDIFGERGIRAISPLIDAFAEALKHGKNATEAMHDTIEKATAADDAEANMMRDLADAQQSASARLTAAWESVKAQLGERVTPQLVDLATRFADFISQTDFGFLATALSNVAEAASNAADFLKSIHLLSDRPKSTDEKIADAEKTARMHAPERQALQNKLNRVGPGGLTEEETRRLGVLNDERREPGRLKMEEERKKRDAKDTATGYTSADELAAFLTGKDTGDTLMGHKTQLTGAGAKDVVKKLTDNPDTPLEDLGLNYDEGSPELAMIRKYAGTLHTARGEGSGITDDERARANDTLNRGSAAADATAAAQAEVAKKNAAAADKLTEAARQLLAASRAHFARDAK